MIERRTVMLASAAALAAWPLAACTGGSSQGPEPTPTGADDPDQGLRTRVVAAESALIAAYDATIAAHPSLAGRLADLRSQHAAHRTAVAAPLGPSTASGSPSSTAAPGSVPTSPAAAVAALAALERAAAIARADDATTASRWQLARLLGLVGGSEAAHHALLSRT